MIRDNNSETHQQASPTAPTQNHLTMESVEQLPATPILVLQDLSSKIDNIKPKLSDGEFLEIMNTMGELYKDVNRLKDDAEDGIINITRIQFEQVINGMKELHEQRLEHKKRLDTLEEEIDKLKCGEDRQALQEQIWEEVLRDSEQVDIEDEFFEVQDSDDGIIIEVEETEVEETEEEEQTSSSEEEETSSSNQDEENEEEEEETSSSNEDEETSSNQEEDEDADDEEEQQQE